MLVAAVSLFSLAATGFVAASPSSPFDAAVALSVRSLAKRAAASSSSSAPTSSSSSAPTSSSYLEDVFGMETSQCESTCGTGLNDLTTCSQESTQATIAACACSSLTLADLRSCASCISSTTTSSKNATLVVQAYNSFVDLCTQEGLVSVTGTVAVGASTKPLSRSSTATLAASSSAASSAHPTYDANSTPTSTAIVPSLVNTGSLASAAATATGSLANAAASATTTAHSGSTRNVAGALVSLFAAGAAVVAFA
ncbi:hypothetical protein JCM1840_004902 [Sporobolomyces johnsonii]